MARYEVMEENDGKFYQFKIEKELIELLARYGFKTEGVTGFSLTYRVGNPIDVQIDYIEFGPV